MRFSLPILLLTATAAMAQPRPAPADKPFVYYGPGLNGFAPPAPVVIAPGTAQEKLLTPPAQRSGADADPKGSDKSGRIELRPVSPDLPKQEEPKPAPKDVA